MLYFSVPIRDVYYFYTISCQVPLQLHILVYIAM
jgi:hypothetical protein